MRVTPSVEVRKWRNASGRDSPNTTTGSDVCAPRGRNQEAAARKRGTTVFRVNNREPNNYWLHACFSFLCGTHIIEGESTFGGVLFNKFSKTLLLYMSFLFLIHAEYHEYGESLTITKWGGLHVLLLVYHLVSASPEGVSYPPRGEQQWWLGAHLLYLYTV